MSVIRHRIPISVRGPEGFSAEWAVTWPVVPCAAWPDVAGLHGFQALTAACGRVVEPGPRLTAAALAGELASRPGRQVHAFVAEPAEPGRPIVGLVALVAAAADPGIRFSIAWLLVDPAFRRRGIATSLVAAAVARAGELGATEVWAESHAAWPAATGFWERAAARSRGR